MKFIKSLKRKTSLLLALIMVFLCFSVEIFADNEPVIVKNYLTLQDTFDLDLLAGKGVTVGNKVVVDGPAYGHNQVIDFSVKSTYKVSKNSNNYSGIEYDMENALYTFEKQADGIFIIKSKSQPSIYLNLSNSNKDADIGQTVQDSINVIYDGSSETYSFNSNGKDLRFSLWKFFTSRDIDSPVTDFTLYRKVQGNELSSADYPGYVKVTGELQDGGEYIITANYDSVDYVLIPYNYSSIVYNFNTIDRNKGTAAVYVSITVSGLEIGSAYFDVFDNSTTKRYSFDVMNTSTGFKGSMVDVERMYLSVGKTRTFFTNVQGVNWFSENQNVATVSKDNNQNSYTITATGIGKTNVICRKDGAEDTIIEVNVINDYGFDSETGQNFTFYYTETVHSTGYIVLLEAGKVSYSTGDFLRVDGHTFFDVNLKENSDNAIYIFGAPNKDYVLTTMHQSGSSDSYQSLSGPNGTELYNAARGSGHFNLFTENVIKEVINIAKNLGCTGGCYNTCVKGKRVLNCELSLTSVIFRAADISQKVYRYDGNNDTYNLLDSNVKVNVGDVLKFEVTLNQDVSDIQYIFKQDPNLNKVRIKTYIGSDSNRPENSWSIANITSINVAEGDTQRFDFEYTVSEQDRGHVLESYVVFEYEYYGVFNGDVIATKDCSEVLFVPENDSIFIRDVVKYMNLSLNGDIGVNVYLDNTLGIKNGTNKFVYKVGDSGEIHKIVLSNDNPSITTEALKISADQNPVNYMRITVNVMPYQMSDEIFFWLEDENALLLSDTKSTSVRTYAEKILENPGAISETLNSAGHAYGYSVVKQNDLVAMLKAMLHYGANAQLFEGYHIDDLANKNTALVGSMGTPSSGSGWYAESTQNQDVITFVGVNMELGTNTSIDVYFTIPDGADSSNYKFDTKSIFTAISGSKYLVTQDATIHEASDGLYYVTISDISSANLSKVYRITAHRNDDGHDEEVWIELSATTYLQMAISQTSGTYNTITTNLLKAMKLYAETSNAYFGG